MFDFVLTEDILEKFVMLHMSKLAVKDSTIVYWFKLASINFERNLI